MNRTRYLLLILILLISLAFRLYILNYLPLQKINHEALLFSSLINIPFYFPTWAIILMGTCNIVLIFLIGKKIFNIKIAIFSSFLYAISPWVAYLELANSLYVLLLFCLLLFILGVVKSNKRNTFLESMLFVVSIPSLLYSSLLMWLTLPILLIGVFKSGLLSLKQIKLGSIIIGVMCLPLLFFSLKNTEGIYNIFTNQVNLFSDVGLVNAVNEFRGELSRTGFGSISRLVENRYFYLTEHFIFNTLKHFTLSTYFSPEFKLLNFSFSPPILIGFLVPFIFGLKVWYIAWGKYNYKCLIVLFLILPSVLSKNSPDLSRLIIFSPVIFYTISYGLINILIPSKNNLLRFLVVIVIMAIFLQGLTTFADIAVREPLRYQKSEIRL